MVEPERWIVAQSGMTKSAILDAQPFFLVHSSVTGIVAAEDCVPMAVMYAGTMFLIRAKGLRLEAVPATRYWITMMHRCMMMMSAKTLANTLMISATVPA